MDAIIVLSLFATVLVHKSSAPGRTLAAPVYDSTLQGLDATMAALGNDIANELQAGRGAAIPRKK